MRLGSINAMLSVTELVLSGNLLWVLVGIMLITLRFKEEKKK